MSPVRERRTVRGQMMGSRVIARAVFVAGMVVAVGMGGFQVGRAAATDGADARAGAAYDAGIIEGGRYQRAELASLVRLSLDESANPRDRADAAGVLTRFFNDQR